MTGYMTNDAHVARFEELRERADRRRAARPFHPTADLLDLRVATRSPRGRLRLRSAYRAA